MGPGARPSIAPKIPDFALRFPPRPGDPRLRPVASHISGFESPHGGVKSKWMIVGEPLRSNKGYWGRMKERRAQRRARRKARRLARKNKDRVEAIVRADNRRAQARRHRSWPSRSTPAKSSPKRGSFSIGTPNRGRLRNGIQLRSGSHYTVRRPEKAWGSPHTIDLLHRALVQFRRHSPYRRELVVHDISRPHGGHFPPHRSHQSGRDVDIRLPRNSKVKSNGVPRAIHEVDWDAAWALVHQLLRTGEVQYIFLNRSRQKPLYDAARRAGVSKAQLARWIQWPSSRRKRSKAVVRHSSGHTAHLHVRFHCAPYEHSCKAI